ncbi:hypothetical protein ACIBUR_38845 [Streptomyces anulatus]
MANKEVDKLRKALKKQGFTTRRTRKNHWMVYSGTTPITVLPSTPSDPRTLRNCMPYLKQAGYKP